MTKTIIILLAVNKVSAFMLLLYNIYSTEKTLLTWLAHKFGSNSIMSNRYLKIMFVPFRRLEI